MKSLSLNQPEFSDSLVKSLVYYLDDGFLSTGTLNTSGNLVKVEHPEYPAGRVWGSRKKNWSWSNPPVVYANNVLVTTGYTVNYKDGLIIFDTAKASAFAQYTYKQLLVIDALDHPFFRGDASTIDVYNGSYRPEATQVPMIAIELGGSHSKPFELGNYNRSVYQDILLNVITNNKPDCTKIADLLEQQIDDVFRLFNYKESVRSGLVPLNDDGFLVNSNGTYNNLCATYPFTPAVNWNASIDDAEKEQTRKLTKDLYHCTVRYEVCSVLKMSV